jgi:hypothetical protein
MIKAAYKEVIEVLNLVRDFREFADKVIDRIPKL